MGYFVPELNRWLQIAACSLRLKEMDRIIGLSNDKLNHLACEQMESKLRFAGSLVFRRPLKEDAVETLKGLDDSSHRVRELPS